MSLAIASLAASPQLFARCTIAGNHLTILRWSQDGNSSLMIAYLGNSLQFIVIEGLTKQIRAFPLSINGISTAGSTTDDVTPDACEKNMKDLNVLLTHDGMETLPMRRDPCRANGPRMLGIEDIGTQQIKPEKISVDKYAGQYESEFTSPSKLLRFHFKGNILCGGDAVVL